ncbi:glycosyltransferase [Leadbetterella sp. DM7]|uniref:glycosyltransferase n=1 Tax=Leadbetterella sp. DM7 TaxID=3235085 RepID=UPI00349E857F
MNILLVTLVFPYPINDGGKSGTFRMVDSLRENHSVTLIVPESTDLHRNELKKLWPDVNIKTFRQLPGAPKDGAMMSFLKKITGRKRTLTQEEVMEQEMQLNSSNLINYYFDDLLDVFQSEILLGIFDLVQIDFIDLAPLVHFIPKEIPKIFVHHELRYKRMALEKATLPEQKAAHDWKIQNTKILEIGLINRFDKVVCLTETDKQILLEDGVAKEKLEVSPLPMVMFEHEINQPFTSENRLLFLGPDQHYPNLDGIDWFLSNCWSEIQRLNPGVRLSIVGRWSPEKRKWFEEYSNITFEGFVPDLETVMKGSVMIVPLRIGSGMRMKILEGVSYHVPVVSTSVGAEGLPMVNDVNCKIADSAEDFIVATHQVLNNPELQNTFTERASRILNEDYSSPECGKKRESIYRRALLGAATKL